MRPKLRRLRHSRPIAELQVAEAIADERRMLEPIRDRADMVVDTGELNVNQLRQRMMQRDRKRPRGTPFVQPVAPSAPGRRILDAEK